MAPLPHRLASGTPTCLGYMSRVQRSLPNICKNPFSAYARNDMVLRSATSMFFLESWTGYYMCRLFGFMGTAKMLGAPCVGFDRTSFFVGSYSRVTSLCLARRSASWPQAWGPVLL